MPLLLGTDNIKDVYLGASKVSKIYLGTQLIYTAESELVIFDNGAVSGYTWTADKFTRPNYTAYANGYVTHVSEGYLLIMVGDHDSSFSHNGHVTLNSGMVIPNKNRMNVTCRKTSDANVYLRFGVLPANCANSYSTAAGGQLISETLVTSTTDVTYSMALSDAVKGQTLYPIINGRGSADAVRRLRISKVWFD